MCPGHWRLGASNSAQSKGQVSLCSASFFSLFFSNLFSVSHFPFLSNPDFNFLCHNDESQCKALILAPFVTGDSQSRGVVSNISKVKQVMCFYYFPLPCLSLSHANLSFLFLVSTILTEWRRTHRRILVFEVSESLIPLLWEVCRRRSLNPF